MGSSVSVEPNQLTYFLKIFIQKYLAPTNNKFPGEIIKEMIKRSGIAVDVIAEALLMKLAVVIANCLAHIGRDRNATLQRCVGGHARTMWATLDISIKLYALFCLTLILTTN